jgi:hypothetical protein
MACRVPVLGNNDIGKGGRHAVDEGHDLRTTGNSQITAIAKTILHIDHDERCVSCRRDKRHTKFSEKLT